MTLPLTPDTLAAAYDYLRSTPPFVRWNLPDPDEVTFKVVKDRGTRGWYRYDQGRHTVAISAACTGHTYSLIATMAHEMVHLHQRTTNMETRNAEHNAAFWKLAARVCKVHGFDPKLF